ncbi:MAG: hypothetical protein C0404_14845 [Verrucomicrobia bacterium]|nr:hypothetical protein [Verrucomicrobiota bacterium]
MKIRLVVWKSRFVEKIRFKHAVSIAEVEQALCGRVHVLKAGRGHVRGEDLYVAFGRTTAGRALVVLFVRKPGEAVMPISARDMMPTERRYYETHK